MEIEVGKLYVCGTCGFWSEERFEKCLCGSDEILDEDVEVDE